MAWFNLVGCNFELVPTCVLFFLERCYWMERRIFLAKVDLPMPGRPTGTKKSLVTLCMSDVEIKSTKNFKSAV